MEGNSSSAPSKAATEPPHSAPANSSLSASKHRRRRRSHAKTESPTTQDEHIDVQDYDALREEARLVSATSLTTQSPTPSVVLERPHSGAPSGAGEGRAGATVYPSEAGSARTSAGHGPAAAATRGPSQTPTVAAATAGSEEPQRLDSPPAFEKTKRKSPLQEPAVQRGIPSLTLLESEAPRSGRKLNSAALHTPSRAALHQEAPGMDEMFSPTSPTQHSPEEVVVGVNSSTHDRDGLVRQPSATTARPAIRVPSNLSPEVVRELEESMDVVDKKSNGSRHSSRLSRSQHVMPRRRTATLQQSAGLRAVESGQRYDQYSNLDDENDSAPSSEETEESASESPSEAATRRRRQRASRWRKQPPFSCMVDRRDPDSWQESRPRRHAFEWPLHPLQILAGSVIVLSIIFFWISIFPAYVLLYRTHGVEGCFAEMLAFPILLACMATNLITAWMVVSFKQAGDYGNRGDLCTYCRRLTREESKHCKACNKCVDHFDHHCKWLNVCIGGKNYKEFIWYVSSALFAMIFMLIICIVYLARWWTALEAHLSVYFRVLPIISGVLQVGLIPFVGHLLLFHIYLRCNGLTSYEHIIRKREKEFEQEASELRREEKPKCGAISSLF